MEVRYSPHFKRAYRALPVHIQDSFGEQIAIFMNNPRDPKLRTHKLKGKLEKCMAFILRDGYRVLFEFVEKDIVNLLTVGPHDNYRGWR